MCFYIHQPYTGCNHGWKNVWSVCRQPDLCQPVEREPPEYVTRKLQPIRGMCRRCEQLGGPEPRERGRPSRPRPKEFEEPIAEPRLARRHHRDFDSDAFHAPEFEDGYPRERGRGPAMRLPQGQHDDFDAPANHNLHINNHLYGGGAAAHTEPNLVIREETFVDLAKTRGLGIASTSESLHIVGFITAAGPVMACGLVN